MFQTKQIMRFKAHTWSDANVSDTFVLGTLPNKDTVGHHVYSKWIKFNQHHLHVNVVLCAINTCKRQWCIYTYNIYVTTCNILSTDSVYDMDGYSLLKLNIWYYLYMYTKNDNGLQNPLLKCMFHRPLRWPLIVWPLQLIASLNLPVLYKVRAALTVSRYCLDSE